MLVLTTRLLSFLQPIDRLPQMQNRNQTQGAQVAWGTPEAYSSPKTQVKKVHSSTMCLAYRTGHFL